MKKTSSLVDLDKIAAEILSLRENCNVITFEASMGAGKTTTIIALCKLLGVTSSVSSPTFSIINEYGTKDGQSIYHLDLYRIKTQEEAIAAGVEDVLLSGNLCFVEWPGVLANLLPSNTMAISITVVKDGERMIEIN